MIRLVFCDVDGTLVAHPGETVSARVRAALRAVAGLGTELAFATGRHPVGLATVLPKLGVDRAWAVCCNGAVLARLDPAEPNGWRIVRQHTFDPAPAVRQLMAAVPGAVVAARQGDVTLQSGPFPQGELVAAVPASLDEVLARPASVAVLRWPGRTSDEVRAALAGHPAPDGVTMALSALKAWLDLSAAGVSKASGAAELAERMGIPPEDVLAIGDDSNDVDLLRWAGRGVAMGNAVPEALDAADEVTQDVQHDGAAVVLEALAAHC